MSSPAYHGLRMLPSQHPSTPCYIAQHCYILPSRRPSQHWRAQSRSREQSCRGPPPSQATPAGGSSGAVQWRESERGSGGAGRGITTVAYIPPHESCWLRGR